MLERTWQRWDATAEKTNVFGRGTDLLHRALARLLDITLGPLTRSQHTSFAQTAR